MNEEKSRDETRCDCFNAMPCGNMMKKMMGGSESGADFNCAEMMKSMWEGNIKNRAGSCLKMMRHMFHRNPSESAPADQT